MQTCGKHYQWILRRNRWSLYLGTCVRRRWNDISSGGWHLQPAGRLLELWDTSYHSLHRCICRLHWTLLCTECSLISAVRSVRTEGRQTGIVIETVWSSLVVFVILISCFTCNHRYRGRGDRAEGAHAPPKFGINIFWGNCYVKFGLFSFKNHVKLWILLIFRQI